MGWLMVNSEGITQSGRLLGRFSFFFEGMVSATPYFLFYLCYWILYGECNKGTLGDTVVCSAFLASSPGVPWSLLSLGCGGLCPS